LDASGWVSIKGAENQRRRGQNQSKKSKKTREHIHREDPKTEQPTDPAAINPETEQPTSTRQQLNPEIQSTQNTKTEKERHRQVITEGKPEEAVGNNHHQRCKHLRSPRAASSVSKRRYDFFPFAFSFQNKVNLVLQEHCVKVI